MARYHGMGIGSRHRGLFLLATVLTFLLVTLGGIVCVTDSSRGCPDWPSCYGQWVPPPRADSILEYAHRALAGLTSLAIVASAVMGWRKARSIRWICWPPVLAAGLLLVVVWLGALTVLRGLGPGLAALDLGSALLVLALMVTATVVALARERNPGLSDRLALAGLLARLALVTVAAAFIVLVSAPLVAAEGSIVRCLGWSLHSGPAIVGEGREWLQLARTLLAASLGLMIMALIRLSRLPPTRPAASQGTALAIRPTAIVSGALWLLEVAIGVALLTQAPGLLLEVLWVTVAAAFWAAVVALAVLAGLPR